MALANKNVDHPVDAFVALRNADKIRLLSRLMQAEGTEVDWAMIERTQRQLPDTAALRREINGRCAKCGANGKRGQEDGLERRLFVPVTSPAILEELIEVIARPAIMRRARHDFAQLAAFRRWMARNAEVVEGEYQELDIAAAAPEGQVPYLVSRDADLLSLMVRRVAWTSAGANRGTAGGLLRLTPPSSSSSPSAS